MHIGVLESNLSGSGFEGLRLARERGLQVTFFTRDLQRYLEVPGAARYFDEYVDEIVHCETNTLEPLLRDVRAVANRRPFDAFMTMGEYDVVLAAEVGLRLGVPSPNPAAVAVARNKLWMRERCARHAVPMPDFGGVATVEEGRRVATRVGLPCVVKPVDETSSTDVLRCDTLEQVEQHVAAILAKRVNTRGQERFARVLVEECLRGQEVSVELLAEGDRFHVLGVTDKSVAGQGHFVEIGHSFPSLLPPPLVDGCARVAVDALCAVGFDLGLAHVEIKVTADGPKLVEINPRPAGDKITELVDRTLGVSCLDLMVGQYLGERVLDGLWTAPRGGAAIHYLSAPPGVITSVSGVAGALDMPGVQEVVVKAVPGGEARPLRRNGDRLGHVLTVGPDAYSARRAAEAAAHEIVIRTEPVAAGATAAPAAAGRRPRVAAGVSELIGHTPMLRLPVPDAAPGAKVVAKLELANPLSSVKDRAALYMLRAAEERGELVQGGTVVEATSGNTGISLAGLAAARGYRCVIVLPDSATPERVGLLRALGAEVVQTPRAAGYPGAIERAEQIHQATLGSWFPRQHENPDNVRAHYETTGPELWADLDGRIDVLVCGVGTGGTLTGAARYLKQRNPAIEVVAAEPERSPVLSRGVGGLHLIPGWNGGFVASTTDVGVIDRVLTVTDEEAIDTARHLARTAGLLVGISSGAAAHAAMRLARWAEYAGTLIATVLPDTGERYLSVWHEAPAAATTGALAPAAPMEPAVAPGDVPSAPALALGAAR